VREAHGALVREAALFLKRARPRALRAFFFIYSAPFCFYTSALSAEEKRAAQLSSALMQPRARLLGKLHAAPALRPAHRVHWVRFRVSPLAGRVKKE